MKTDAALSRYAGALFKAAQAAGEIDKVESDLNLVMRTFESNPDLEKAFISPLIPDPKKMEIISEIFKDKISDLVLNYMRLLIENRREPLAVQTALEFTKLADEARGIAKAQITAAMPLEDDQSARLAEVLSRRLGKQVSLDIKVDPKVIGGLVIRIEDTVFDGSVAGYLNKLREEFTAKN